MKNLLIAGLLACMTWGADAQTVGTASPVPVVTENGSYASRHQAVQRLGENLNENEIRQLVVFLQRPPSADVLGLEELNALKNEVLNALKRQSGFENELAEILMDMHKAPGTGVVWKDYCIQHLGGLFEKLEADLRRQAAELFFRATDVKDGSLCGTALIALKTNVGFPEVDEKRVRELALQVANPSSDWETPARITAIQICAQFGEKAILPDIRRIMSDEGSDTMLRMSAIAAIGALGNEGDLQTVARLSGHNDFRIKRAALAAEKRIKGRQ